jgi:adenylylsulfate kinase
MVIWIIGLSRSGKTSLAKALIRKLNKRKKKFIHVDGDVIRKIYNDKIGYTMKEREINAERISKLTKYLSDEGINVIGSILSNFPKWQNWNKKNIKNYKQIFLKANLSSLLKRDTNNLYKNALKGKTKNVVGLDLKFRKPIKSSIIIDNNKYLKSLEPLVKKVLKKLKLK